MLPDGYKTSFIFLKCRKNSDTSLDTEVKQPFGNTGQIGLSYLGPKIWTTLHSHLKSAKNVNSFKHKIKDKFFKDLQNLKNSPCILY